MDSLGGRGIAFVVRFRMTRRGEGGKCPSAVVAADARLITIKERMKIWRSNL